MKWKQRKCALEFQVFRSLDWLCHKCKLEISLKIKCGAERDETCCEGDVRIGYIFM